MINIKLMTLILLGFILSSCAERQCTQHRDSNATKYKFEKIDTTGIYIDLDSIEIRNKCSSTLVSLNSVYTGILNFYDWQIDEYNRVENNTSSKK